MNNPIALGMVVIGVLLLAAGVRLLARRKRIPGAILAFTGLALAAAPFVITFYLYG